MVPKIKMNQGEIVTSECNHCSDGTDYIGKKMRVQITDDFDLNKIADSGQCFRVRKFEDGTFRFITRGHVLCISKTEDSEASECPGEHLDSDGCRQPKCPEEDYGRTFCWYNVSCTAEEWKAVWSDYFDLDRCYRDIRRQIPVSDGFLSKAADEGTGIRILHQDHWETLVSFIISQRKSIPAIKSSIEMLCTMYGQPVETSFETVYTFPTAEEMTGITMEDLIACKTGYRAGYILDAVERVKNGSLDLTELENCPDEDLNGNLMQVYGVGKKVAVCVSLFSYGRSSSAPVDTWIQKVFDHFYNGSNFLSVYGDAGILQQYVFYYALKHKEEFG